MSLKNFFANETPQLDRDAHQWQRSSFPIWNKKDVQVEGVLFVASEGGGDSLVACSLSQARNWLFELGGEKPRREKESQNEMSELEPLEIKRAMPLRTSYFEGMETGEEAKGKDGFFEFRLNGFKFFCKDKKDYEMWTRSIRPVTIRSDFHDKFHPIRLLGEGASAKVIQFLRGLTYHLKRSNLPKIGPFGPRQKNQREVCSQRLFERISPEKAKWQSNLPFFPFLPTRLVL